MPNDLSTYNSLLRAGQIKPGDALFFDGSDDSDISELVEHFVSNAIEVWTHSTWSHVALVLDIGLEVAGKPQTELNLIESTMGGGKKSGPQVNSIRERLASYDGTSVWLFQLRDDVRGLINFSAIWPAMLAKVGKDHYSIKSIVDFLARPFLGWLIPRINRPDRDSEVCSEYAAQGYVAGGINNYVSKLKPAWPMVPHLTSQAVLSQFPIWKTPIRILPAASKAAAA